MHAMETLIHKPFQWLKFVLSFFHFCLGCFFFKLTDLVIFKPALPVHLSSVMFEPIVFDLKLQLTQTPRCISVYSFEGSIVSMTSIWSYLDKTGNLWDFFSYQGYNAVVMAYSCL